MENETPSLHSQLQYRLKRRISEDIFNDMPPVVQEFLLNMPQEDIKEAFLTTLLRMPWQAKRTAPKLNLRMAKLMLDTSHYAMENVKEKIMRFLACQRYLGSSYGSVLLLSGAPGVGKTSIATSIARAMGRPFVKISLAGVSDALFLRGMSQMFRNARPGRIVESLINSQSFSPVILLDEIDKMGNSIDHGCPETVLLDILDSDRSLFVDNYLNFPLDLSNVVFIATANSLRPISPVLLDRMDVVELPSYTAYDKERIGLGYLWPKLLKEYQLDSLDKLHQPEDDIFICTKGLELSEEAAREMIRRCTDDGVRELDRMCRTLCEAVISIYLSRGELYTRIEKGDLDTLLGPIFYPS